MSDFDSPWKEALEHFFPMFLAFFFPEIFAAIDWSRGYESLDNELQKIVREAEVGRRIADKLFKVWLHNGAETWILIHVEVQGQREDEFPERMFVYNYRLYDRHRQLVVSLALLTDEQASWRPTHFGYSLFGCKMGLDFLVAKLLDYRADLAALETNANPFAALVLAHLKTLGTRHDPAARRVWKFRVIRGLYERGLTGDQVRQLFRLIDWMMDLPKELEAELRQELYQLEEEKQMPYVTSIERFAQEKGIAMGKAEGKAEMLLFFLQQHYTAQLPADLEAKIRNTSDQGQLEQWAKLVVQAGSLEEFRRLAQL